MTAQPLRASHEKRLVIFGCGYVGGEFARQALARGFSVTALTRNKTKADELRAMGITAVVAELASEAWHALISPAPDVVLNCVSSGGAGLDGYRCSYVEGMNSILRWAEKRGPVGTFVFTSSTSVYAQGGGARVDENTPTDAASERGRILLEAEGALRAASAACRRWFVVRLAGIYGPQRHVLLDQVRRGEVAGVGGHRLNLAHRDDICSALWSVVLAREEFRNEILNVADDRPAPKTEVVHWLASRLGVPPPRFTKEAGAGRRPVTPDRIIANAKLREQLGWRPRYPSYREGYENILSR